MHAVLCCAVLQGEVDRGGDTKTKAAISNTTVKASKVLGIAAEQLGSKVSCTHAATEKFLARWGGCDGAVR